MNSPRYSSPANHIKAQISKAPAIHRDREPEAENMMRVSGTGCAGPEAEVDARGVSMNRSGLRGADAKLSVTCRDRYTIAAPFPEACSRKMTGIFRLAVALLATLVASG